MKKLKKSISLFNLYIFYMSQVKCILATIFKFETDYNWLMKLS